MFESLVNITRKKKDLNDIFLVEAKLQIKQKMSLSFIVNSELSWSMQLEYEDFPKSEVDGQISPKDGWIQTKNKAADGFPWHQSMFLLQHVIFLNFALFNQQILVMSGYNNVLTFDNDPFCMHLMIVATFN